MDHEDDAPDGHPDERAPAAEPAERGPKVAAGRPVWTLLAVVALLGGLLVAVVLYADIPDIADEGWRGNALWALAAAVAALGGAVGALAWTAPAASTVARGAVLLAVAVVVAAVVVVGVADEQGGERRDGGSSTRAAATEAATGSGEADQAPIGMAGAADPANLTSAAIPVTVRTPVVLELTVAGRRLVSTAMRCRTDDLVGNRVDAAAIGGNWAEPLVLIRPPVDRDGDPVDRCAQVLLRLPVEAGVAMPTFTPATAPGQGPANPSPSNQAPPG